MKKQIGRSFIIVLLCFSWILLFKSAYVKATDRTARQEKSMEAGYETDAKKEQASHCVCGRRILKFYWDGKNYITIDVAFLACIMVLVFLLALEKVCG